MAEMIKNVIAIAIVILRNYLRNYCLNMEVNFWPSGTVCVTK